MIGAERGNHLPVFEQRRADKRRDLPRPERRPLVVAQPLIGLHVVDDDGLAAPERLAQRRPRRRFARALSDERLDAAGVLAANDVARGRRVPRSRRGRRRGARQDACAAVSWMAAGVAQRPERVVQPEEKRQPLFVRAQLGFRLAVLERRPDPIGDFLRPARSRPASTRAASGCGSRTRRRNGRP